MDRALYKELSENNPYHLSIYRSKELVYFCRQYMDWVRCVNNICYLKSMQRAGEQVCVIGHKGDRTAELAIELAYYEDKIAMVDRVCEAAHKDLAPYIRLNLTEGVPYESIYAMHHIPYCNTIFHKYRRKALWLLDKERG